jgi:endonuclease/exonuclease/phosphatase (EEP) superfamily protein YafD
LVVTSFNVHTNNRHKEEVVAFLQRSGADVIFLYEVDQAWVDAAAKLAPPYRLVSARPSRDNFGILAIARVPVSAHRVLVLSSAQVDSIELTVPWHGAELVLLGTHALPPISEEYSAARDEQLAKIGEWSRNERRPHAVVGDFNATPWSAPFRSMLERGELRGPTAAPTWPYTMPLAFLFRIPIDHALLGKGLFRSDRAIGAQLGSDHRPLTVSLTPRY